MTDDPIHDLREAIDALVKPVRQVMWQDTVEDGVKSGQEIRKRTDPSLLEQLRAAISNSSESNMGASKPARERTPLDVAAFQLHEEIDGRIRAWLADAGQAPQSRTAAGPLLSVWFIVWTQRQREREQITDHTAVLHRWEQSIKDLLSPPTRQEITSPCPLCGSMWATVGRGEETESVRALWAVWRSEHPDESFALCRNCDHFWRGIGQMRLLRIAIDDREQETLTA